MRKFLMGLMVASALVPAAAVAQDAETRAERVRERGDRAARPARDRPAPEARQERTAEPRREERRELVARGAREQRRGDVEQTRQQVRPIGGVVGRVRDATLQSMQQNEIERRNDRSRDGSRDRDRDRRWSGDDRTNDGSRDGDRRWSGNDRRDRDGVRTWRGTDNWRGDWRQDRRYSWQRYRDQNRSLFRVGRYYDPYGWGYRRLSIGFSLGSSYYGSNYWLNDPWQYRLPPAYGPYRWVRYYDDALLVNIYTGQVVDVVHSFFW
ncbi:RcnB family protein [Sphingomonas sp. LY160]|uniref:RcnB family protein n=1 Tax=Sphingomonas sp. LY160 TaxID=3095342 RepID=UPI002ADEDAFA|nr:RcnB family protein [Sphingomonas sp. LY160]MEA1072715.1 RcnB family protein [Sphingomonas sp. LY160]